MFLFGLCFHVASFYGLGAVIQHDWCSIYTTQPLAQQLSANQTARNIGLALFVVGELINFYHHMELASLRPEGSTSYVIPRGGLFNYMSFVPITLCKNIIC